MSNREKSTPSSKPPTSGPKPRTSSRPRSPPPATSPKPSGTGQHVPPQKPPPGPPGLMGQMAATAAGAAIGSAVGHSVAGALVGSGSSTAADSKQVPEADLQDQYGPCAWEVRQFLDCAQEQTDLKLCEGFNEALRQCRTRNRI